MMKVFIAGARSVLKLDNEVIKRLHQISEKEYDVLIGDCNGVDTAVQKYYTQMGYQRVTVFASNGVARNNVGGWTIHSVPVESNMKGFDFYKQKDIAMANDADYGFMIWDGRSKGTLNNMINLLNQGKKVLLYLTAFNQMCWIEDLESLQKLVAQLPIDTQKKFQDLTFARQKEINTQLSIQLSVFQQAFSD
jgi:hypothetical protein